MSKSQRPRSAVMTFRGVPHELDLVKCRLALVQAQVKGEIDTIDGLARAVGISRSTASRFLGGHGASLAVSLRIIGALGLRFKDVAQPLIGPPGPA